MEFDEVIKKRKSVRSYLDEEINDDDLKKIAKSGQIAPKAGEFQITIIKNKNIVKEINDLALNAMKNSGNEFLEERAAIPGYQPLYGAPVLILLSAPDENEYGGLTSSCAAENMILTATNLGLGSCYMITPTLAFLVKSEELSKKLNLPKGFKVLCGIAIGKEGPSEDMNPELEKIDNVNFVE